MSEAPAFQFYSADYLADVDVQLLTSAQEGIYIRLLNYCWRERSIPNGPEIVRRLCKSDAKAADVEHVMRTFFVPSADSQRLTNPRLDEERKKQAERRNQASEAGRKSAATRNKQKIARAVAPSERPLNERSESVPTNPQRPFNDRCDSVSTESNPSSSSSEIPLTPSLGGEDFNDRRRKRERYQPIGENRDAAAVKEWIGKHSTELIPRDKPTVSQIVEAAVRIADQDEFFRAVDRISKGGTL